jgi:hypothetical protein
MTARKTTPVSKENQAVKMKLFLRSILIIIMLR